MSVTQRPHDQHFRTQFDHRKRTVGLSADVSAYVAASAGLDLADASEPKRWFEEGARLASRWSRITLLSEVASLFMDTHVLDG
jgi:hypothetical protein